MRSYVEAGIIIAACGSAIFWFMSAICRLPTMKPGADEIDHGELSKVLQRMNRLNFCGRIDGRNSAARRVG